MKEYCTNRAYNERLKQEEEKKEQEYQKKLDKYKQEKKEYEAMFQKWQEEDRQRDRGPNKELEKQKETSKQVEQEENRKLHESIQKEIDERKETQKYIQEAHKIINSFSDDINQQNLSHKKIEELAKESDPLQAEKIKNAIKKQFYDSTQMQHEADVEYQNAKDRELEKKGNYVKGVKDTSLTINKVLSKFDPTGTGEKIVGWQEDAYTAIEGHEEGGVGGAIDKMIEKKASDASNGWSDTTKAEIERYKKYKGEGLELSKDEEYYDQQGNRMTKVKMGQQLYDKKGNKTNYSFMGTTISNVGDKANDDYNHINSAAKSVEETLEGIKEGDINKAVNAGLDALDAKDSMNDSTDSLIKKVDGKNDQE